MGKGGAPSIVGASEHVPEVEDYHVTEASEEGTASMAEPEGGPSDTSAKYEVVFVKDNVSVHPSPSASERISGRLRLIKQGQSVFLTWIPYNQSETAQEGSLMFASAASLIKTPPRAQDRNLYTIRAVSVSEIRSIRRHTPTLGWNYIIIVLTTGLAFPPLYFHNGGVREFLNILREHALLVRSAEDANVYIVNDIQDPLQRSLTQFDLMEAVGPTVTDTGSEPPPSPTPSLPTPPVRTPPQHEEEELRPEDMPISRLLRGPSDQALTPRSPEAALRDASLQILEKFSVVTRFARDATNHFLGKDLVPGIASSSSYQAGPGASEPGLRRTISEGGAQKLSPVSEQKDELEQSVLGNFELVEGSAEDSPALVWGRPRPPPLGQEEWLSFLDAEGRIGDPKALTKRVFHGGVEHNVRQEVWKFLLGYYEYASTSAQREELKAEKKKEYEALKRQWQSISEAQARRFAKFRERKSRIDKDVVRTDRTVPFYEGEDSPNVALLRDILITYSFYNFDLGYCQGMSDLLSPLLFVMRDEAEAFWTFAALMERMASNFHRDQNGMHGQLLALQKLVALLDPPLHDYFSQQDCLNYFFCFRWILIQFKREFAYEDVLRLWEVLWSCHLSNHFHLYLCAAILKRHRRKIMDEQMEFDTLLKFINELSGKIDLESSLRDAEALCRYAGPAGEACMPPAPPPTDEAVLAREVELMRSDSFT